MEPEIKSSKEEDNDMKLIKAVVNMPDRDNVIVALAKETEIDNIMVRNINSLVKQATKEYSYRGKTIQASAVQNIEKVEISCCIEDDHSGKVIQDILAGFSHNTHTIELNESRVIDVVADNNNSNIKIGFVIPVENELIMPIYREVFYSGYGVEKLTEIPSTVNDALPYDMIVIDVSRHKFSVEELAKPLYLPIDIPIVIVNRSETPIDKIAFIKIGFRSIHDIKNPDIILSSIYSVVSEYKQENKKKILPRSADMSESKFAVVFSCFA